EVLAVRSNTHSGSRNKRRELLACLPLVGIDAAQPNRIRAQFEVASVRVASALDVAHALDGIAELSGVINPDHPSEVLGD
ncbi:hypothetical protein LAJ57_13990, partial [Streptococcus pneumoniae]|uniref:hypothetical protein n=1 Tax=Streptococcus pneumoniae TaxID=1313 RepID=UPI001CBCFFD8